MVAIVNAGEGLLDLGTDVAGGAADATTDAVGSIGDGIVDAGGGVVDSLTNVGGSLLSVPGRVVSGVFDAQLSVFSSVGGAILPDGVGLVLLAGVLLAGGYAVVHYTDFDAGGLLDA